MRALLARDIAPFTKILAKMELKESIKSMFGGGKEQGEMTADIIWGIIENYHKVEKEFFAFLAELEGKKPEGIADLPLPDFINLITELFGGKNLPFFKSAAKLTQRK